MTDTSIRNQRARAEFYAEHQKTVEAQETQKREQESAPVRAAEREFKNTVNELARAEREVARQQAFREPSEELKNRCKQYVPDTMTAEQVTQAIRESFDAFRLALSERGVTLEQSALQKFARLSEINITCDTRDPMTFMAMFEFMDGLGLLELDCTKSAPVRPVTVAPVAVTTDKPIDESKIDPESWDSSSREGLSLERKLTDRKFWKAASPLFHEWIQSLYTHWNFVPSEEQKKQAFNLIEPLNLNPHDRRTYDVLRRAAIARGIFPPELLTNDEILQRELEEFRVNNPTASPREERIWFTRRSKEIEVHA